MSEARLNTILGQWREAHGPEVMRNRRVETRTIVDVAYSDGTIGKISRADFGVWEIEKSPDKSPAKKTKAPDVTRAEDLAAPNLKASLSNRNAVGD